MIRVDAGRLREPAAWITLAAAAAQILVHVVSLFFLGALSFAERSGLYFGGIAGPVNTALIVGAVVLVTRFGPPTPKGGMVLLGAAGSLAASLVFGALAFLAGLFAGDGFGSLLEFVLTRAPQLALVALALLYVLPMAMPESGKGGQQGKQTPFPGAQQGPGGGAPGGPGPGFGQAPPPYVTPQGPIPGTGHGPVQKPLGQTGANPPAPGMPVPPPPGAPTPPRPAPGAPAAGAPAPGAPAPGAQAGWQPPAVPEPFGKQPGADAPPSGGPYHTGAHLSDGSFDQQADATQNYRSSDAGPSGYRGGDTGPGGQGTGPGPSQAAPSGSTPSSPGGGAFQPSQPSYGQYEPPKPLPPVTPANPDPYGQQPTGVYPLPSAPAAQPERYSQGSGSYPAQDSRPDNPYPSPDGGQNNAYTPRDSRPDIFTPQDSRPDLPAPVDGLPSYPSYGQGDMSTPPFGQAAQQTGGYGNQPDVFDTGQGPYTTPSVYDSPQISTSQPIAGYPAPDYGQLPNPYHESSPGDPRTQQLAQAYQQAETYQQAHAGTMPSIPYPGDTPSDVGYQPYNDALAPQPGQHQQPSNPSTPQHDYAQSQGQPVHPSAEATVRFDPSAYRGDALNNPSRPSTSPDQSG
ncbi:hypothetical protein ACFFOP_05230 [Sinosporangium siamense]|uniref:hypothetical protein n=1 Tax=Sinosporangium siamense TaxID=1367973 RepID=UPI0035EAC567